MVDSNSLYRARIVEKELSTLLNSSGAVVIEGPKACGKTATARQFAASEVLLDVDEAARLAAKVDPRLILQGPAPRLIDEWQIEPSIWNHIRRTVDDRGEPGQFILAGSSVPTDDITRHSGAGRIARLQMRPMSLYESGHSTGTISLGRLLAGDPPKSSELGASLSDLTERIAVGGWPGLQGHSTQEALRFVRDYLDEIRRLDIIRVDGVRRDPQNVSRLLRSLARNISTCAAATTLALDVGGSERGIDDDTVRDYLSALRRLMIIEDQQAWAPHLRSRSVLRSSPKRHFVDPSLAVAALRITPERLLGDLNLLGYFFESLVVRDLRVYAQASDAQVLHYRDNTGLEVDAIVETADGRWSAWEVKLGPGLIDEGARSLLKFADRVDTDKCGPPAILAVIVASGYGYVRDDGIGVVPICALGP